MQDVACHGKTVAFGPTTHQDGASTSTLWTVHINLSNGVLSKGHTSQLPATVLGAPFGGRLCASLSIELS